MGHAGPPCAQIDVGTHPRTEMAADLPTRLVGASKHLYESQCMWHAARLWAHKSAHTDRERPARRELTDRLDRHCRQRARCESDRGACHAHAIWPTAGCARCAQMQEGYGQVGSKCVVMRGARASHQIRFNQASFLPNTRLQARKLTEWDVERQTMRLGGDGARTSTRQQLGTAGRNTSRPLAAMTTAGNLAQPPQRHVFEPGGRGTRNAQNRHHGVSCSERIPL